MKKKHIADALSLLRVPLSVAVLILGVMGLWISACTAISVGWTTDALDGIAARRWESYRTDHPNSDVDGWCDIPLCFLPSLIPVIYAFIHTSYGWILGAVYITSIVSNGLMVHLMHREQTPLRRWVIAINMPIFHMGLQIVATLGWFAYMAFGASVAASVCIVLAVAIGIHPKLRTWMKGQLA